MPLHIRQRAMHKVMLEIEPRICFWKMLEKLHHYMIVDQQHKDVIEQQDEVYVMKSILETKWRSIKGVST